MLRIVTFLWNDDTYRWNSLFRYGSKHVHNLFSSIDRNLKIPHENVLITDDLSVYAPDNVRKIQLWDDHRNLPGWRGVGKGCYVRLKAFSSEMASLIGPRFVWLDLDTVVTGSLDSIFDRNEDFVAWKDSHPPTPYCGSMIMMDAGARERVWTSFNADPHGCIFRAKKYIGTDQAHIGVCLGLNEAVWKERDGVLNFRADVVNSYNGDLPEHARLVFFTGKNDPSMPELQQKHRWIQRYWR